MNRQVNELLRYVSMVSRTPTVRISMNVADSGGAFGKLLKQVGDLR